ncbi:MAG: hypothetical protein IKP32_07195 [Clostridia bacterium]|nr:hypothetical protein [Clostridia bacterium]
MKRLLALALALMLCAAYPLALADGSDGWYCPQCGRLNYDNFCPSDGTARPTGNNNSGYNQYNYGGNATQYSYVTGRLNRKLATRTGPSTKYDEPGSFLTAGASVIVHSRSYDSMNEIWWLQVEFTANGEKYWAYTGLKRVDGINLYSILEEKQIGECYISQSTSCYYGPSYSYKQIRRSIPAGVSCKIYGYVYGSGPNDSDFIQVEFYDYNINQLRRAWVPDWTVDTDSYIMYYGF